MWVIKFAVPSSIESKKVEIALCFSTPARLLGKYKGRQSVEGREVRTFELEQCRGAGRVDENSAFFSGPSVIAQRCRGLSIMIVVVCKSKVITVFVSEYFPHEWYILGAEQ